MIVSSLLGCNRQVNRDDLVGHYSVRIADEKEEIALFSNGLYENSFSKNGVIIWRYSDSWRVGYESTLKGFAVTFNRFKFGFEGYGQGTSGFWAVKPERSISGVVSLCFDPDLPDRCFVSDRNVETGLHYRLP